MLLVIATRVPRFRWREPGGRPEPGPGNPPATKGIVGRQNANEMSCCDCSEEKISKLSLVNIRLPLHASPDGEISFSREEKPSLKPVRPALVTGKSESYSVNWAN
jgi:hypothetical protein